MSKLECAVCLQTCIHPVQLPCTHIFCFLCVKGAANRSKKCALCRQEIPHDYLSDPKLLENVSPDDVQFDDGYQWFYEGRNGWWQYDERTSVELEEHFKQNNKVVELLVAGFLYVIDFDNMIQYRRNDATRRRRVKRDLIASTTRKGVAGLKVESPNVIPRDDNSQSDVACAGGNTNNCAFTDSQNNMSSFSAPSNTPHGSHDNSSSDSSPRGNQRSDADLSPINRNHGDVEVDSSPSNRSFGDLGVHSLPNNNNHGNIAVDSSPNNSSHGDVGTDIQTPNRHSDTAVADEIVTLTGEMGDMSLDSTNRDIVYASQSDNGTP